MRSIRPFPNAALHSGKGRSVRADEHPPAVRRCRHRGMNRRFAAIQALFSLVALAAVVWWASRQDAPELPSTTHAFTWLAAGAVLYAIATLLRGERWHRILHLTGVDAERVDSYGLTAVGYMGNNVLPARAGEMLRVVLLSRRTDASKRTLLGTVVAERLLDAIALASILVAVVYGFLRKAAVPSDRPLLVAAVALVVLALAIVGLQVL